MLLKREMMVPGAGNLTFYWIDNEPVSQSVWDKFAELRFKNQQLSESLYESEREVNRLSGKPDPDDEPDPYEDW
jgi:hypothetical protein